MATPETKTKAKAKAKYTIDIEGTEYPWDQDTITPAQIRELAGLPADQPVIQVNQKTNAEHTLAEDAVVEVKPGLGFGKKVRFQRG